MKLSTGIQTLTSRNVESSISKKILLANTSDKKLVSNNKLGVGSPADPVYFQNSRHVINNRFSADIRYRNNYNQSPLNSIYHRNNLLLFAQNNEIQKALTAIRNEIISEDDKAIKYILFPQINTTQVPQDKQEVAVSIQKYIDEVFYPKLYQILGWKKNKGLQELIEEYLTTGKICYEIVYDNLMKPKEIVNMIPLDTTELSKIKEGDYIYYVQKPLDGGKERILHENQVVMVEWNENDFGFISYVEKLKRSFNIMRGMQTSKILWFAVKSQVRMHINLNMGDISRPEAIKRLNESKNDYVNDFDFDQESGELFLNAEPSIVGYKEFFTAETSGSGSPDIQEINTNGPDLTEVDSLQYWEKSFWKETEIPYDRIDPSSQDNWSFVDVTQLRKTETNFGKFIAGVRNPIEEIILKPLIIQLTLKEIEIGIDLSLLDSIKIEWVGMNQYDELGNLELINKKVELATNLSSFGVLTDVNGLERKSIPTGWIIKNYLDFSPEQLDSMEVERLAEDAKLGFPVDEDGNTEIMEEGSETEEDPEEDPEEDFKDIASFEDSKF